MRELLPQFTKEQAIALSKTRFWEKMTAREIAEFQSFTLLLCMPFDVYHKAMEETLGRPVYTHEFASDAIYEELRGERPAPTLQEIIELIPAEKRIVLVQT